MHRYRLEIFSHNEDRPEPLWLEAPDIATALIVADINMTGGSAELWDGDKQIACLQRQPGTQGAFWRVTSG